MKQKLIINADDFGISPGVNAAIVKAYHEGVLNSTSIMMNLEFTREALALVPSVAGLNIGLHLNLTNEVALSDPKDIPMLVDGNGRFKNGFVMLLVRWFFGAAEFRRQVAIEMEAQIQAARRAGIKLSHIDSHRYVHMIPGVFSVAKQKVTEHKIPRIRIVNENIFNTWKSNHYDVSFLWDGAAIKWGILYALYLFNRTKSDTYYYSVLYTCKMFKNRIRNMRVSSKFKAVEIPMHPNIGGVDTDKSPYIFDENVISQNRVTEMKTIMDKDLFKSL